MRLFWWIVAVLGVLALLLWLGLRVRPRPFPALALEEGAVTTIPLPQGLPPPVERFYRTLYGDAVPVVNTIVLTGRGRIAPMGFFMPARFVFAHEAGQSYRHYIEATWFGIPLLRVDEGYLDGRSFFEALVGNIHDDPKQNQGANLALWAEALWFPSIFLTDPRVRWEPLDADSALLVVPFAEEEEQIVVRFDPATGLIVYQEAMRYHGPDSPQKTLWIPETVDPAGVEIAGYPLGTTNAVTWIDQKGPWAYFTLEDAVYNADLSQYMRGRGL